MRGALLLAILMALAGPALGQDIEACIVKGDITNNPGPVKINLTCRIVQPEKLGAAEVRFIPPKLVDVRTIADPASVKSQDEWLDALAVLSVETMSYEHVTQPAVRAQVHAEEAYLAIGPETYRFRPFQWVDIGTTGKDWLGRVGDARPFAIDPGAVEAHTTQFKAVDAITWRELTALLESQPQIKVAILAKVSQSNAKPGDGVALIQTECYATLTETQKQIVQFRQKTNKPPRYVEVLCGRS